MATHNVVVNLWDCDVNHVQCDRNLCHGDDIWWDVDGRGQLGLDAILGFDGCPPNFTNVLVQCVDVPGDNFGNLNLNPNLNNEGMGLKGLVKQPV